MDERYIKIITIDQIINKRRNQRPGDIDGSPGCDYQKCEYDRMIHLRTTRIIVAMIYYTPTKL